ncbi:MAG: hypothetical protein JSU78_04590 [Deltaproteobacteria bacterium]|nr:MAG: hypothetical protein JSU78_04590 [Deltaproteobacteria bacterium]
MLTLMGTPLLPADFRSETMDFPQNSGNSGILKLEIKTGQAWLKVWGIGVKKI